MTATVEAPHSRSRTVLLCLLAVTVGSVVAWLALVGTTYVPSDSPLVWIGLPLLVISAFTWLVARRFRWIGVSVAVAGVLTVAFFVWLLWQFGQGSEGLG